jgi:hypothetical protein
MGMKKIEAKRAELKQRQAALAAFVATADKLQEALGKVQKLGDDAAKAYENMYQKKSQMAPLVAKLDTMGIKEFAQYKDHLTAICENKSFQDRLLPMAPMLKVVKDAQSEADTMLVAWLEKQAAAMPKEFKKGMTFQDYTLNRVWELTSDPFPSKNSDHKGDFAIWFETSFTSVKDGKTGTVQISKGDLLKYKLKFLRM